MTVLAREGVPLNIMSPDMLVRADEAEFEMAYDGMLIAL